MTSTIDQRVVFAARSGNMPVLKARVRAGGDINYVDPQHGSALVVAITHDHVDVVEWLIGTGADVNAEYHYGVGPLEVV